MKMNGPEQLAKVLANMNDEIINWRFTFEDILKTDGIGVQNKGLFLPLKTVMDELKETLFSNVSERVAVMLKEDLESLGPIKTSKVEKAQQNIIYMCKQLEVNVKILLGGGEALV
jgi:flagellar motor switch protein FliG